uniref:(northern house mosquito) hypothetical protein n=1 Tax=Culex pipiens TaxID=7175 RepID=A0A8D8JMY8_CULPI
MQKVRVKIDLKTSWFFIYDLPPYSLGLISFVFFFFFLFAYSTQNRKILANLQRKALSLRQNRQILLSSLFSLSRPRERRKLKRKSCGKQREKDAFRSLAVTLSLSLLFNFV